MDNRNVFVAIALSMSVLLFWGAFFDTPPPTVTKKVQSSIGKEDNSLSQNQITPNINQEKIVTEVSRKDSLVKVDRVIIDNENISGSISLKGAIFDDISFKNYKKILGEEEKVVFLNPRETKDGYYIETGWTSIGNQVKVPTIDSLWKVKGNKILNANSSVILEWDNNEGLIFKKIELDEKFLFKINQEVINKTSKSVNLYPYAQITRNRKPDDVQGFYILHEGFIGVFDGELKEDGYDDVEDKKISRTADNGWLGITDKYWVTAIVPPKDTNFKSTFLYKDTFKANYILNSPVEINPSSSSINEVRLFVAAKEVNSIDSYAESEKIEKFDLTIDWGWFYFFTKPLFFVIDYLFKISGNFGIAIVLVTLAIRIIFFPLANYSFRSMAKMKALQPEMVRLKEIHKDDKVKLQQEMMALYKKEKVNPASGCLPILIQIPLFFAIYKMLFISLEMRHQPFLAGFKTFQLKIQPLFLIFSV